MSFSTSAEKIQAIQDQVNAKIHWDASVDEVLDWLEEKHGIEGDGAEAMLRVAQAKRRNSIRERGLYLMILCGIAMAIPGTFLVMEWMVGRFYLLRTLLCVILFGFCFLGFLRGLARVLSGKTTGTVDL